MPISTVITPFVGSSPSRSDPTNFPERGDSLLAWLVALPTQINAAIAELNALSLGQRSADGTLAAPGMSFASETSSGLRRGGAGDIRLTVGGADKLVMTSTGQVLVGTSTVQAGAVGTAVNDVTNANVALYTAGNSVYLEQKALRHTAGADWTGLGLELRHRVDLSGQGYVQFNGAVSPAGVTVGAAGGPVANFLNVASANRAINFAGSNGGNPTIGTTAGNLAIATSVVISGGSLSLPTTSAGVELGQLGAANTPYIDFHSGTTATDYDVRFQASGGTTSVGMGTMTYSAGGGHAFVGNIKPSSDNAYSCGEGGFRWTVVHAATSSINTSDARLKTAVAAMTAAEISAAIEIARELGTFQFLDSIDEKGPDKARLHIGTTVQRVMEIMESHGLEPLRYAFICYDRWPERTEVVQPAKYLHHPTRTADLPEIRNDQGEVLQEARCMVLEEAWTETLREEVTRTVPAGDRYAFRTDQMALFIARAQAAWQDQLSDRITQLEARLLRGEGGL